MDFMKNKLDKMIRRAKTFTEWKNIFDLLDADDERREQVSRELLWSASTYDECKEVSYLLDKFIYFMRIEFGSKMYNLARNEEERTYASKILYKR